MTNTLECLSKALKNAGEIYLDDIVLAPYGRSFDADVAEFAINFAVAARTVNETGNDIYSSQLLMYFKGATVYDLPTNSVKDAGGVLTWGKAISYKQYYQVEVQKENNCYNIRYYRNSSAGGR